MKSLRQHFSLMLGKKNTPKRKDGHQIGVFSAIVPLAMLRMPHVTNTTGQIINRTMILHYDDVIMTTTASQITSLTVVYSIVYSRADQRKHQSSASLAFVRGIHRDRWIPRTKGQ